MQLIGKKLSILISAVFIVALISASPVSFSRITALAQQQQSQDFLYSIMISPKFVKVQQGDFGIFNVQVTRGSSAGQFSVDLSVISDSLALKAGAAFTPSQLNFEEGQSIKNATLKINSYGIEPNFLRFRVGAITQSPSGSDQAMSNPVALIVGASESKESSNSVSSESASPSSSSISSSNGKLNPNTDSTTSNGGPSGSEQKLAPQTEVTQPKANNPPVAKAGADQTVNEGDKVTLDGSASSDPDKDAISYSWQQLSPRAPIIKLHASPDTPSKVNFVSPDVVKDTTFQFKLTIKDSKGGIAADSVNILVKNEPNQQQSPKTGQQQLQSTDQQQQQAQLNAGQKSTTENHSPTAQDQLLVVTEAGKGISINLKGSDPDASDTISYVIVTDPSHGTLAGFDKTSGSLTYIPATGFSGQDNLAFKVVDSHGAESNPGAVSITVNAAEQSSSTSPSNGLLSSNSKGNESSSLVSAATPPATSVTSSNTDTDIIKSKVKETGGEKIPNQYVVVLKEGVTVDKSNAIANDAKKRGANVLNQYDRVFKGFSVKVPNEHVLAIILNRSEVAYAEPDVKVQAFAQTLPSGINRVDGDTSITTSGDGTGTVDADLAIVDTGIQLNHPDLNVYRDVTFVVGTTTGNDDNGHGTHVAGIAAAKDNAEGVVGMAPGARLWAVKVLDKSGSGSLSGVIAGIDYVTKNSGQVDVLNLSLGCKCHSNALDSSIHNAVAAGVTVVVAAGNSASNAQSFSPANNPDVIAVSAIADSDGKCGGIGTGTNYGKDDTLASFSNYGSAVDMAAPGVNIFSTYKGSSYATMSGTSMASPHVAGAAALYKSQNPSASPAQVRSALVGAGSTSKDTCDGNGHGYFSGDKDNSPEPLLYAKNPSSSQTQTTSAPSSGSGTSTGTTTTTTTTGATAGNNSSNNNNTTAPVNPSPNTNNGNTKGKTISSSAVPGEIYRFVTKWGSAGSGNGQFNNPHAVAVDSSGNAYVVDSANNRVQVFDSNGNFIRKWGTQGANNGQFNSPQGIAVDKSSGNVFVADTLNNRVQKFTSTGTFLLAFDGKASGSAQFNDPEGIGIDSAGNVYVSDVNNHRIAKFSSTGTFILKWGTTGSGNGQFKGPHGVAVDSANNVFVSDYINNKLQKFSSSGAFMTSWGGQGSGDGKFSAPHGVAVDAEGSLYVADRGNNRVQKFTNAGGFLTKFGTGGSGDGQFNGPDGMGVGPGAGSSGKVYVTDVGNNRVQVFAIDNTAPGAPNLVAPQDTAVTNNDKPLFDWSDVTDPSGVTYNLLVDNDIAFGSPEISVSSLANSQFTPSTALADAKYYWKVNAKDGAGNIGTFSSVFSFTVDKEAPTVTATPAGGLYNTDQSVSLNLPSGEPSTTKVYYTTDGSDPTTSPTRTLYSGTPIAITAAAASTTTTTLKFFGLDAGGNSGTVGTEVYTIDKEAPTVTATPAGGLYNTDQSVTLALAANEPATTKIFYTTDGTDPTASSTQYTSPIGITAEGDTTLKFIAIDAAGNTGTIGTEVYTIDKTPPTVTADPAGGSYKADQSVTLTASETNTVIYYTTDGTDPTTASTQYSAPIPITTEGITTLKFFGKDAAGNSGTIATEIYTLDKTAPTVASTEPITDAIDVPVTAKINVTFSEPMAIDGSAGNFSVVAEDGTTPVTGTVSWSADNKTATFTPSSNLDNSPSYTVTVKGGTGGIADEAGNPMLNDYSWSFSTPASISLTLDSNSLKWGVDVNAQGSVTNDRPTDKISIDWGDGSPATLISPIPASGQFTAKHAYAASATTTNPNKVVAKLLSNTDVQRAVTADIPQLSVTVQKHATSLTVAVKDGTANGGICVSCQFTAYGKLKDTDTNTEITGKTIAFSGSGVPPSLASVQTAGVKFFGTPSKNLTVSGGLIHLPVGSEITLPSATEGVVYKFSDGVDLSFTKGNDQVQTKSEPSGSGFLLDNVNGLKKVTITGVSGGSTAELVSLETGDPDTGFPETDTHISVASGAAPDGDYPTIAIEPGSYFSTGNSQDQDGNGLTVTAAFNDANDPAYTTSSAQVSYDVGFQFGVGEGTATAYNGVTWTKLTVGSGTAAGDVCTDLGVAGTDNDKDGICDRWEDPNNAANGNDATHRYITCPTNAGPTAMDAACPTTSKSIKYNLCFNDQFASAWGKADGTVICPTLNHKDIYVEIDYMANHAPSTNAIKNVIKAFGNSPVSNSASDGFGSSNPNNPNGITLHVVVSDQFARTAPFNVWTGTDPSFNSIKNANWGTAAERGGTSGMPGMTAAGWTSTGKTLKHYAFHYGQWITYYGGACTAAGLSSGLAELLGNDFIVSLGCGFGGSDPSGGSVGTDDEQAGTFMHELGHNLNLAHGGAATLAIGSTNYNMNCKPNYLSVMNYARQMPNAVLVSASWESSFNWRGTGTQTTLDYARASLPNLAEGTAPETTVMTPSDGKQYWIEYGTPTKVPAVRKVLTGATVDWDGSGVATGTPSVDLNSLSPTVAGCGPVSTPSVFPVSPDLPQTLNSYSDWDKLNLVFTPDGDSQDGVTQKVSQPFVNPNTRELKPVFLQSIQDEVNRITFIPPPNPDGSTTFNTGSSVPLKFLLKDKNGNPIANAAVTLVTQKGTGNPTVQPGTFAYDPATTQYKYIWNTPSGNAGVGVWTLSYIINYGSTNPSLPQTLLQGPNAQGPYTLKITGVK